MRIYYSVLATILTVAPAIAQVGASGTIQGTIKDPSDAILPGASVTATSVGTGIPITRETNTAGFFVITPLQAGEYSVTIKANFGTLTTQANQPRKLQISAHISF